MRSGRHGGGGGGGAAASRRSVGEGGRARHPRMRAEARIELWASKLPTDLNLIVASVRARQKTVVKVII